MRKSLLIIMSVAILGGLGMYINRSDSSKAASAVNPAPTPVVPTTSDASATSDSYSTTPKTSGAAYKDGTYEGSDADTIYGTVQVAATITDGKITGINFLQMPNDQQNSKVVTAMAEPSLRSQALSKQSAHIDFVSGATQTSEGFERSLQAALDKAAA